MGCAPSAPSDPPRPVVPSAAKLVLTTPGAANQLVFDRIEELRAGKEHVPLTLSSHPGLALVRRSEDFKAGEWLVVALGIGSADNAVTATYERRAYLTYSHGGWARKVLDITNWKYEVGNEVNFVGHHSNAKRTYLPFGGREFVLNPDGTVGAKFAPKGRPCVLGVDGAGTTAASMQVVVPDGLSEGQAFVVQTPSGGQMQVNVPKGSKGGNSIMVQVPAVVA